MGLSNGIAAGVLVALATLPVIAASPYAGLEDRAIKALGEEQVDDLRAGRGMGLALAAELNGYPGPRHVLDHADELSLDAGQRAETQRLFTEMQAGARALGERIIDRERALDRLFADRVADASSVAARTAEIARLNGELRAHHLDYHLRMVELLTPEQVARYGALRGYASERAGHGAHRIH